MDRTSSSLSDLTDPTALVYRHQRIAHWDAIARKRDAWRGWGGAYHRRLAEIYRFLISPGRRVLEIGCGTGELLAAIQPSYGVGVDFSAEMVQRALQHHPGLHLVQADAHDLSSLEGPFDYLIFSDIVNDAWDVQMVFEQVKGLCKPRTRLVINHFSNFWEIPLTLASRLGLATRLLDQNWLTQQDVTGMLSLSGFEVIRTWKEMLWPLPLPLLDRFF
ncbi:MAG: class I SAM-dependent methyltransferase, partial [Anaerolineales bacterium]|nr:class I SAM-dependent methyltransferase [Anaerolineales bacterium]